MEPEERGVGRVDLRLAKMLTCTVEMLTFGPSHETTNHANDCYYSVYCDHETCE